MKARQNRQSPERPQGHLRCGDVAGSSRRVDDLCDKKAALRRMAACCARARGAGGGEAVVCCANKGRATPSRRTRLVGPESVAPCRGKRTKRKRTGGLSPGACPSPHARTRVEGMACYRGRGMPPLARVVAGGHRPGKTTEARGRRRGQQERDLILKKTDHP